jgi:NADPH-dependent 2,4-dienoyl-CoA reductase/sulfur reductase-like enzyme
MRPCTRRGFGFLAGATCLAAMPRAASAGPLPRVVVIGGGPGGATAARYLAMSVKPIDIVLVEPKTRFTTCFFSNLYLAGLRSFESITFGYEVLADRYGVKVVHDRATEIDPVGRTVRLQGGARLPYDRLVVAPGIAFRSGAIAGYDEAAAEIMPHAWMAGPQTELLRRQLEAMPDGGVFTIVAPPEPYRCPPGPYERASMVAAYFKAHKPRSKVLILDTKDGFFEQDLFQDSWNRHYRGMIEWLPNQFIGDILSVDAKTHTIRTSTQVFKADVGNIIPAQMAASLAQQAGLADPTGWCPVVAETFESKLHAGIHLVGDATSPGDMPKSAFAANMQAKACAFAIETALTGADPVRPFLYNTCYTFLAPDDAISDAIDFKISNGRIGIADIEFSRMDESGAVRAGAVREANAWYDAFTQDIWGERGRS